MSKVIFFKNGMRVEGGWDAPTQEFFLRVTSGEEVVYDSLLDEQKVNHIAYLYTVLRRSKVRAPANFLDMIGLKEGNVEWLHTSTGWKSSFEPGFQTMLSAASAENATPQDATKDKQKFPTIAAVSADLRWVRNELKEHEADADGAVQTCDVRLQVYEDGTWALRRGSSDYDMDHRGFWGASAVASSDTTRDLQATARNLLAQVREHAADNA